MQNEEGARGVRPVKLVFILHSFIILHFPPVPVVERRPRERAKLEVQVQFLAGALDVDVNGCAVRRLREPDRPDFFVS